MTTRRVSPAQWKELFDEFTRRHLRDDFPETVTIEVVSPELGDQRAVGNAKLLGLTYDPKSTMFEIALEGEEHLVFHPVDIWVMEDEADGFLEGIDLFRADGTKEIVSLRRAGVPAR